MKCGKKNALFLLSIFDWLYPQMRIEENYNNSPPLHFRRWRLYTFEFDNVAG